MHTDQDVTRIVRSWLRTDEHESAAQILEDVLAALDTTPQRRSWWPARRIANVNPLAKLAAAAVSVVVVAVIGITLLPVRGETTGPAGPSPSATPSPSPSPSIAPIADALGSAGRYRVKVDATTFTVAFPANWTIGLEGQASAALVNRVMTGGQATVFLWNPDNVYLDPCDHVKLSPAATTTADGFAQAVSKMRLIEKTEPATNVVVGGRPARHLVITIPKVARCAAGQDGFQLWYNLDDGDDCVGDVECPRFATQLGDVVSLWLVDVPGGGRVIIEGETPATATSAERAEIQQVVDSIQFG
jgi:hypothetical protein